MDRYCVGVGTLGILLLLWAVPAMAWAQTPASSPAAPSSAAAQASANPTSQPVEIDLNKIRNALLKDPVIRFDEIKVKYYVEVYGHQARFWDFVGDFNFRNGPVPHAGMTHQEFLDHVTPQNMYFGPPTFGDVAKVAAATAGFVSANLLLNKLRTALRNAVTEAEKKRIQVQIDRELAALAGK